VRAFVPEGRRYSTLGTDGFGRSDTRAALRRFFAVDADSIVQAALKSLGR
jgi:pyruvate dehydrogenase E1 component